MSERFGDLIGAKSPSSEIVRAYLRHSDILQDANLPSAYRDRLQQQRIEMLEMMKPEEKIELAEFGREIARKIRQKQ